MEDTHKIIAAGGLVYNASENLLMIFRRGYWDLPKGKLDEGETIEMCAVREVEEETGLQNITLGDKIGITCHNYFDPWTKQQVTKETHWFAMRIQAEQVLKPQQEEDIEKAEWVTPEMATQNLKRSYANIVAIIKEAGFLNKQ